MANNSVRNPAHKAGVREKIRVAVLIDRLQRNAEADQEFMTPNQIKCAEILLKKSLPDLSSVQHTGDAENPIAHTVKISL